MKNHYLTKLAGIIVPVAMLTSCVKMNDVAAPDTRDTSALTSISVPEAFNYKTTSDVALNISLLTNDNKPLANVLVNVLDKPADQDGQVLLTVLSDANGQVKGSLKIPSYFTKITIDAAYIGLVRNAAVRIDNNTILATIGGSGGYSGNVLAGRPSQGSVTPNSFSHRNEDGTVYKYIGKYTSAGKPEYLEAKDDVISSKVLANVNASLPEGKPVPTYHPDYLKSTSETNININDRTDVWVTFVHEGAGYQNTLAYFTYPTDKPPTKPKDISDLNIMFPNASYKGSGGDLASGNRIYLGKFDANTSIGFCLIANGWSDNTKEVGAGLNKFYSVDALNPETDGNLKRHTILLKDEENKLFLIGFDDQRRDKDSDNDFNDLIFYVTSSVPSAISTSGVNAVDKPVDSDGDGVNDTYDQFPNDPLRAYINYYPSAAGYTSTAFEDTWPNTGDYDLNDVVVDQRYKIINNGQNKTIEIFGDYVLRASGGSFSNGFGVQFPFSPSLVASVTGSKVTSGNTVTLAGNGCETGQAKAVIFPFDDFYAVMPRNGKNYMNTDPAQSFVTPDTIKMKITFTTGLSADVLGSAPFNPFIICNKNRGSEVHLPGELPTSKANILLFNTSKDNTVPSINKYYKTATNLPFGICIPQKFEYPIEGKSINTIYLKFVEWAQSGGILNPDWYKDSTGYRLPNYFYKP